MKPFFKFEKSQKFKDALDKTFAHFESMTNEELIALAEKHAPEKKFKKDEKGG